MIKLNNVSKIYSSKSKVATVALDNINLQFSDKEMVFICGKSGSGKSTLLHLIGGLDSVTRGSVEVDSQIMSKFSSSEYDAYRNTYVGFIFQEFNLIDEYTVRRNIELALKLQGEKVTQETVLDALAKVGMEEYIDRYPNELSGGQKQRVAIARAIIKSPDIILADEPTGALDSDNGRLVLDLLKELSKTKLVIVVTHDIESAKMYGDRIVELKDGKVISDSAIGSYSDDKKEYKTIPSKLPFLYALRMGWTGLRYKRWKLIVACTLLCISLTMLGVASIVSDVDVEGVVTNSVIEDEATIVGFRKNYNDKAANYQYYDYITDKQLSELKHNIRFKEYDIPVNGYICQMDNSIYDKASFHSIIEIDNKNDLQEFGYELLKSAKEISADNEVYITDFLADSLLRTDKYKKLNESYDLIGETIVCDFISFKIVGIVDTKYAIIENDRIEEYKKKGTLSELSEELNSIYGIIFANRNANSFFYSENGFGIGKDSNVLTSYAATSEDLFIGRMGVAVYPHDSKYIMSTDCQEENKDYVVVYGKRDNLKEDEIIVSPQVYMTLTNASDKQSVMERIDELDESLLNVKVKFNFTGNYDTELYDDKKEKEYTIVGIIVNTRYKTIDDETGDVLQINTSLLNVGDNGLIVSGKAWNQLIRDEIGVVSKLYIECSSDREEVRRIVDELGALGYRHDYKSVSNLLYGVEEYTDVIAIVFMYLAIILFVFVTLLLSNYINISIAHKRKEIGILRAIGARSTDVVKIFMLESVIIAVVSAVLAIVCELIVTSCLNNVISKAVNISIEFIHVYVYDTLIVFGISMLISVIATIISTRRITKQKPVDAIRGL